MTQWNRTFKQSTNGLPLWRANMVTPNRLYYVSADIPGNTTGLNESGLPTHFGQTGLGGFGAGWDIISGYSSGVLLENEGGPWGKMVYGTGGHTRLQNQILSLDLNMDSPAFGWWQQPTFQTADVNGAELYYSPAEQAVLEAGPRGAAATIPISPESAAGWDKQFPVGFDGWIYPRKMVTGQMGNGVPHGYRYGNVCYIPPEFTGDGDGRYLLTPGPQGPFSQSAVPADAVQSEWYDAAAFDGGGNRRTAFYMKNVRTGVWSEHKWQPTFAPYGFTGQQLHVFRDLKRMYALQDRGSGTAGWWYIDFTNGIGNFTVSSRIEPATSVAPNRFVNGTVTDGHPSGRHLGYFPDLLNTAGLIVQDFDNNVQGTVNIGQGLNIPTLSEASSITYDAANNRLLILLAPSAGVFTLHSIPLPVDPFNAGGYVVTTSTLTFNDPAMSSQSGLTGFSGKTRILPHLNVILVPYGTSRMLGFVPA